jgi:hypothetical protein
MTSQQDYINLLTTVNNQLKLYFSYCAPWLGIALAIISLGVLLIRKRREKNLIIYLFAWQYAVGILFCLNILFLDPQFSLKLFGFTFKQYVSDPVCKLSNMFLRFFYCLSPWMQVVINNLKLNNCIIDHILFILNNVCPIIINLSI